MSSISDLSVPNLALGTLGYRDDTSNPIEA